MDIEFARRMKEEKMTISMAFLIDLIGEIKRLDEMTNDYVREAGTLKESLRLMKDSEKTVIRLARLMHDKKPMTEEDERLYGIYIAEKKPEEETKV